MASLTRTEARSGPSALGSFAPGRRSEAPSLVETVLAGALLLLLAGGLVPLLTQPSGTGDDNSSLSIVLQGVGCLLAAARLARSPGGLGRALERLDPFVLALVVVLLASVTWSVDPSLTARRVGAVGAATLFGLYLADRWSLDEQMWLVLRVLTMAAVASALMVFVLPNYGLPDEGGGWRGIFVTKNVLARLMALGVLAGVLCASKSSWPTVRRRAGLAGAAVCGLVMLQADSVFANATVAGVLVLVAAGFVLVRTSYPLRHAAGSLIAVTLVAGTALLWLERERLLDLVGRDANLTGRLPLWSSVWPAFTDRPWLGHGYGAFWQGWNQPSTEALLRNPWGPPHAHNGVIETALNVGVVGAALWLLAVLGCLVRGLSALQREGSRASLWPVAFVLFLLAFNLTEVTTMGNAFFWSLFIAAAASLTRRPAADLELWTGARTGSPP